jgi:hypothetical protein
MRSLELQTRLLLEQLRLIDRAKVMLDADHAAFLWPNYVALETAIADLQGLLEAGETVQ